MIALGLEYDGRSFCGWQRQTENGDLRPSVQATLEAALAEIAQKPVSAIAAGRTDAGVHASLQVVHFAPGVSRPLSAWVRGVNAHLPDAVAVRWAHETSEKFHARFSAVSRRYVYWLLDRDARPGLHAGRVGWTHLAMDVSGMHDAAQALVGTHDFSSFRASECQAKTPIKTLHSVRVTRAGAFVRVDIHANAFLHHMVRNIVGALVYVGAHKIPTAQFATLLAQRNRALAPPTFSADGLYLSGIEYPAAFGLPESFVEPMPSIA
jgi:tRNA pseudouridine38-40 synthase